MNWENERAHFQNYDFDDPKIMNLITHCSQLTHMYGAKAIFRLGASGVAWLKVRSYRGGDKSAFPIPTERIANFCDHLTFSSLSPTTFDDWQDKCATREEIHAVINALWIITDTAKPLRPRHR